MDNLKSNAQDVSLKEAAEKYASEKYISIKELKNIHGKTQLWYAFKAGAEWQRNQEDNIKLLEFVGLNYKPKRGVKVEGIEVVMWDDVEGMMYGSSEVIEAFSGNDC